MVKTLKRKNRQAPDAAKDAVRDDAVIVLKDGTKVPADDFWLYAPTWMICKYGEPV
jgi:hypothetical protein